MYLLLVAKAQSKLQAQTLVRASEAVTATLTVLEDGLSDFSQREGNPGMKEVIISALGFEQGPSPTTGPTMPGPVAPVYRRQAGPSHFSFEWSEPL